MPKLLKKTGKKINLDFFRVRKDLMAVNLDANFYNTRWGIAIFKELGISYDQKKMVTYLWALKLGQAGFSPMPGEGCWSDSSFMASAALEDLGVKLPLGDHFFEFVSQMQNKDGGFGDWGGASTVTGTVRWVLAAKQLGFSKIPGATIGFLKKSLFNSPNSYENLLGTVKILLAEKRLLTEEKNMIGNSILQALSLPGQKFPLIDQYYQLEILNLLGFNIRLLRMAKKLIPKDSYDFPKTEELFSVYASLRIKNLLGLPINKKIYESEAKKWLHPSGVGFCYFTFVYFCTYAIFLVISNGSKQEKDKLKKNIEEYKKRNGDQSSNLIFHPDSKTNYWFLKAYIILGGKINKEEAVVFLGKELEGLENKPIIDIYYTLLKFYLLEVAPNFDLVEKLDDLLLAKLKAQKAILYDYYRLLACLFIVQSFYPQIKMVAWEKNKEWFKCFVDSCENKSGGFSHLAQEESGIQPTYQGIMIRMMMDEEVKNKKKHWAFLQKCNTKDGFSGNAKLAQTASHLSYYGVMSALLLGEEEGMLKKYRLAIFF